MNGPRWHRVVNVVLVVAVFLVLSRAPVLAGGNISITRTFQPSSADATLQANSPDTNFGSGVLMEVRGTGATGGIRHAIVEFSISSLPTNSTVSSATLSIYLNTTNWNSPNYRTHSAYRVLVDWSESTVTWNTPGSTAGTHYASSATSGIDIIGGTSNEKQFYNWTVTTDVSNFVSGAQTNYGWRVIDTGGTASSKQSDYASRENATTGNRPKLSVTFTAPWDSYNNANREAGDQDDNFSGSENTVYMKGTGFLNADYLVAYYDGNGVKRGSETITVTTGTLNSQYVLTSDQTAIAGIWHVLVQPSSGYTGFGTESYATIVASPDTYGLLANDSFDVAASAIPEFPTVIAATTVVGLCFGIYWWLRRKQGTYVKA